jgi:hypothetical protein
MTALAACDTASGIASLQIDEGAFDGGFSGSGGAPQTEVPPGPDEDAGVPLPEGGDAAPDRVALFGGTVHPGGATTSARIPVTARSIFCGDGIRGIEDEQCDDGPDVTENGAVVEDSCSADCQVTDLLAVPPGASGGTDRYLGEGRHPAAATEGTFAVAFVEPHVDVGRVAVSTFTAAGARTGHVIDVSAGSTPVLFASPVIAPLPGGAYAVAWTDFGGDGDELGIALRRIDTTGVLDAQVRYANRGTAFSQASPDILWVGDRLVVAWEDHADPFSGPDIVYRVFDEHLAPRGGDVVLSGTADSEANVALAPFGDGWAAAWRIGLKDSAGLETIAVSVRGSTWRVEPAFTGGPPEDRPAIVQLDDTHLLVVFTVGTDPNDLGFADTARLRGAVIDTAATPDGAFGEVAAFPIDPRVAPYATDAALGQLRPNAMRVGAYRYVAWQSERVLGDSRGDELWLKPLRWSEAGLDLSIVEVRIPQQPAHHEADQRFPALAASPLGPFGALVTAWDDLGRTFDPAQGTPDVGVALLPVPLLSVEPPIPYVGCTAGEILVTCDSDLHCAVPCNGAVGDRPEPGDPDDACVLAVARLFEAPLTDEAPGTTCEACPPGQVSCFGEFCFVPCDGVVQCGQDVNGLVIDDESAEICGAPG